MEKDPALPNKIIFFDGVCHLCNGFVTFIISRDQKHIYRFAPLQGETAKKILSELQQTQLSTVIYFESPARFSKSSAVLRIITGLGGTYTLLNIFWIIPRGLRDLVYDFVAKNRYRWFGKSDFCRLPSEFDQKYLLP